MKTEAVDSIPSLRVSPMSRSKQVEPNELHAQKDAEITKLREEITRLRDELQWERDIGVSARKTVAETSALVDTLRAASREAQKRHDSEISILNDEWRTKEDEMMHKIQARVQAVLLRFARASRRLCSMYDPLSPVFQTLEAKISVSESDKAANPVFEVCAACHASSD